MKYIYSIGKNKVVCIAHYEGKSIKGVAKCNTDYDVFNEDIGMKLARLRCDLKVAEKHCKKTTEKYIRSKEDLLIAEKEHKFREQRYVAALKACKDASKELITFEDKLINS